MGRSDLFLKLEIQKKIVGIIALIVTIPFGVLTMAYSLLATSVLSQIINAWPNSKLLHYNYLEQLKDILPNIGLSLVMGIIIRFVDVLNLNIYLTLVTQVLVGGLLYFILSILTKNESYLYIKNKL